MDIDGKVAIVTGASSGIGLATARLLTQKTARVALVARSRDALDRLSKELPGSLAVPADMTREDEVKRMVETVLAHYGRVDILINNAGQGYDASTEQIDIKTLRQQFELSVIGPLVAMQAVIPVMRREGGGAIVNISSGLSLMYLPNTGGYSAAKRALNGLSLTARNELAKDNIAVSVVYPFMTDTNFERNTIRAEAPAQEAEGNWNPPQADPPELVAQKILKAIDSGEAEQFVHEWMGQPRDH